MEDIGAIVEGIIKDVKYCPCLLIGKYVVEFKKRYKGNIISISNLDAVREVVDRFSGIYSIDESLFVIDGVGFLSDIGQNSLLKFIEESDLPILVLSYYDRVSPIIMSRMKFIFKYPENEIKNLKFMKLKDGLNVLEDKTSKKGDKDREGSREMNSMEIAKFYAENCPIAFQIMNSIEQFDNSGKRIVKIISNL